MQNIKGSEMKSLTEAADRIVVVDFSASWCGPCQMLHPVLEALSAEMSSRVHFYKVDVDESQQEAALMGIRGVPTLIVFHKGTEIDRQVGFRDKADLKRILSALADRHLGPVEA